MKYSLFIFSLFLMVRQPAQAVTALSHPKPVKSRIIMGWRNGSLTSAESQRLLREQRQIRHHARLAKMNDGHIGPRERKALRCEKRRVSRHIFRMKHNKFFRR